MISKKQRILQSAEEEFLLRGYDGTSIDAIVRVVGGSKSTVYAHFPDKKILFAEALRDVREELNFGLAKFSEQDGKDLRENLVLLSIELLSVLYDARAAHLFRLVIAEARRFPEVARQFYEEGLREASRRIASLLSDFGEPEVAASHLFALLRGEEYFRFLLDLVPPPEPRSIVSLAEEAVDAFLMIYREC